MRAGLAAITLATMGLVGMPAAQADGPLECIEVDPHGGDESWLVLVGSSEWIHLPKFMGGGEWAFDVALPVSYQGSSVTWVAGVVRCILEPGDILECTGQNLTDVEAFVQCIVELAQ